MPAKNRSRGKNRRRRRLRPAVESRNWAELPHDVLSLVFRKLGGIDVLWPAQAVCRPWRQLALDPDTWRCVDFRFHSHSHFYNLIDMEAMEALARVAIDRSAGRLEEFYAEYFGSDELLQYISDRTTGLRCLVLISAYDVSEEGLAELVGRCPFLEELQITNCTLGEVACRAVGRACPELKRFCLNTRWYKSNHRFNHNEAEPGSSEYDFEAHRDKEAFEIADNMPALCELQIIGNQITNKGVRAILNKCPLLEALDIRACFNVNVDTDMRARLARIARVRLPHDSTSDYGFMTGASEGQDYGLFYSDYGISENLLYDIGGDSDFSYDDFTVPDYYNGDYDGFFGIPGMQGFPGFFI